ncbi:MAG: DUF2092 domain-containing protein [Vulcanimicrobiaceae bacterium]
MQALFVVIAVIFSGTLDTRAMTLLQAMSATIANSQTVVVTARVRQDQVAPNGQMRSLFYGATQAALIRPDRLYTATQSDRGEFATWFDGQKFTIYDPARNMYAQTTSVGGDDAVLDALVSHLRLPVPLAPFLTSDPYSLLGKDIVEAHAVGPGRMGGVVCEQLAFSGPDVDWRLWVTTRGASTLPVRVTVLFKNEPNRPRTDMEFLSWSLNEPLLASKFHFEAPPGAVAGLIPQPGVYLEPTVQL